MNTAIFQTFRDTALSFIAVLLLTTACNKDLNTNFTDLEVDPHPVVECFLEPGQPIRLTLSRSDGFFAPFDTTKAYWEQVNLISDAQVIISGSGFSDTLSNQLVIEPVTYRIFNYSSKTIIPYDVGAEYNLDITLANGEKIQSYCKMLDVVEIDSMSFSWSPDIKRLARVVTYFDDNTAEENYYQYVLRYDRSYDTLPRQNLPFPDEFFGTPDIAIVGTYDLREDQEAIATLIHINADYHEFLRSTSLALAGSQNPVVLPAKIKSNVYGSADAIGIFTTLAIDRDTIKIK